VLRDIRKNKLFSRRALILGGVQAGLISTLAMRLGYLQIVKHDEYSAKSDNNRIRSLIVPAPRGVILDRNGQYLSKNNQNYRLLLYTEKKYDISKTIDNLSRILELNPTEQEVIRKRIKNTRKKSIASLIDNLSWNDLAKIEANYHRLNGIAIEKGLLRQYSFPYETAHLAGYVSLPADKEIDKEHKDLFLHPDFTIGKSGIEKSFDEYLRGQFGIKYVEVSAYGIPIRTISEKQSVEGKRIQLTIDLPLQRFIANRIKDVVASVVVMDVKTGELISMVSSPSFNPNEFSAGVSHSYWKELLKNPKRPLTNKAISAQYPPGSTFKLMAAIAALENNFNPNKKILCKGSFQLGTRTFRCWEEEGHGWVNMSDAIKHSCNTYFFNLANQIGIDNIARVARKFGYGQQFDISIFGVQNGLVPSRSWKKRIFRESWKGGDTLNSVIGQGFVLATPLQMAVVTSRLANGGIPIVPHLVKNHNINNQFRRLQNSQLTSKKNIDFILHSMNRVVNEAGGTAYGKRINIKGFKMAGKTGTSQVVSKREDEMTDAEIDKHRNHAIFVGFAPANNPKYSISVVVEHGGSGSAAAAPIARDIMFEIEKLA
jgi:penicillin-binding protein 2